MRSVTVRLDDLRTMILNLGYVGENEHRTFRFDCKRMLSEYPSASVSLAVQPPAGGCYPATVERDGDLVSWTVTDSDLIEAGNGELQLTFMVGDVKAKTCIGRTKVERSLPAPGRIPTPIENWIEQAEEVISEAEAATAAAEDAAEHQPIIDDNGYWAVWDADAEEYIATEYKAQGTDGHDGVGIVSIEKTGTSGLVDTYTITFTSGNPVTYTVTNGRDADPAELIDDTAGSGDTDKVWSADKSSSLLTEINSKASKEELQGILVQDGGVSATLANAENTTDFFDTRNGSMSCTIDGNKVLTCYPNVSDVSPYILTVCSKGSGTWLVGFKFKFTRLDSSIGNPNDFDIKLGNSGADHTYIDYEWDKWIDFSKVVTLDLSRITVIARSFSAAPTSDQLKLEIKDLYVYNVADVDSDLRAVIAAQQKTNYQDGTVTYSIPGGYVPDTSLTEEGKAADSKAVGDAINGIKTKNFDEAVAVTEPLVSGKGYSMGSVQIGDSYTSTTTSNENVSSQVISVEPNTTYYIYGVGNQYSFNVVCVLDGTDHVIDIDKTSTNYRTNPKVITPSSAAAKIIVNYWNYDSSTDHTVKVKNDTLSFLFDSVEKPMKGKTILLLGDSILGNDRFNGVADYLKYRTGATIINGAIGGARICGSTRVPADDYTPFDGENLVTAIISGDWTEQDAHVSGVSSYVANETLPALKAMEKNVLEK